MIPRKVTTPTSSAFRWFAVLTCLMTWLLIGVGGVVTSQGVGMSVPDWPNTYGYNMFYFPFSQWIGGIFWEHSHRLVASVVGFMTLLLAVWAQGKNGRLWLRYGFFPLGLLASLVVFLRIQENQAQHLSITLGFAAVVGAVSFFWPRMKPAPKSIRRLAMLALGLVIVQGMLGGLRVTLYADQIGIFHATLAQIFLVLIASIALLVSPWWQRLKSVASHHGQSVRRVSAALFILSLLVLAQLLLGATMRHQHAGLAVSGFPLAYDQYLWPPTDPAFLDQVNAERLDHREFEPITASHIHVHMVHRVMAVGLFMAACALMVWTIKWLGWHHPLSRGVTGFFSLISLQATLGVATVLSNKAADLATLHVLIGALTLVTGCLMVLAARRSLSLANVPSPVRLKAEVTSSLKPEWSSAGA